MHCKWGQENTRFLQVAFSNTLINGTVVVVENLTALEAESVVNINECKVKQEELSKVQEGHKR